MVVGVVIRFGRFCTSSQRYDGTVLGEEFPAFGKVRRLSHPFGPFGPVHPVSSLRGRPLTHPEYDVIFAAGV